MSISELIEKVKNLPKDKQIEVMDFVEFLSSKKIQSVEKIPNLENSPLKIFRTNPFIVTGFTPLTRNEANER
jgi:hypothetical protein